MGKKPMKPRQKHKKTPTVEERRKRLYRLFKKERALAIAAALKKASSQ
jgi:hypothetical protein